MNPTASPTPHSADPNARPRVDAAHPWLGPLPFSEETRGFFFGREKEIGEIFQRVRQKTLTVLYGPSGLGKTSLLGAGLIPALREAAHLPVLIRLSYPSEGEPDAPPPPAEQVRAELATALETAGHTALADACRGGSELWALFHDTSLGFLRPGAPRIVFLLDQFEEIFTLGERSPAASRAFLDELADLVENRPSPLLGRRIEQDEALADQFDFSARPVKVVLVLREDYLSLLERRRRVMPSLMENRMELGLLSGPQALDAVVKPGRLAKDELVSEMVGCEIVRAVAEADPDTPLQDIGAVPPFLSLMCRELNRLRLESGAGQIESELVQRQKANILKRFYTDCFQNLPEPARRFVEDKLLSPNGRIRESLSWEAALDCLREDGVGESLAVLNALLDRRLISSDERGGERRIELTHDILVAEVRKSRDRRKYAAAVRKAENKAQAASRRARRRAMLVVFLCLLLVLTFWGFLEARRQRQIAEGAATAANQAMTNALKAESEAQTSARRLETNQIRLRELMTNLRNKNAELTNATNNLRVERDKALGAEGAATNLANELTQANTNLTIRTRELELANLNLAQSKQSLTKNLFASYVNYGVLLARNSQYDEAQGVLDRSRKIEWDPRTNNWVVEANALHTRNLLAAWVALSGADAAATNTLKPPVPIRDIAVAPDGAHLVAVGEEGKVAVFSAQGASDAQPQLLKGHQGTVNRVVFTSGGQVFLTGGDDQKVIRWSFPGCECVTTNWHDPGPVRALAANSEGSLVASAGWETGVKLRTIDGSSNILPGSWTNQINDLAFSDAELLAAACNSGHVLVWRLPFDVKHGLRRVAPPEILGPFPEPLLCVTFAPGGKVLYTGSHEGAVQLWALDVKRAATPEEIWRGHRDRVLSLATSVDGNWLISSSWDQTLRWWNVRDQLVERVFLSHTAPVTGTALAGDIAYSGSTDATWRRWSIEPRTNSPLRRVIHVSALGLGASDLTCCALAPDASAVAVGMSDGLLACLELPGGTKRLWPDDLRSEHSVPRHSSEVSRVAFSPDGLQLASASVDGSVKVWESATGKPIEQLWTNVAAVNAIAFSADGRWLAFAGQGPEVHVEGAGHLTQTNAGVVGLFDRNQRSWRLARIHQGEARSVAFDPQGDLLASAGPTNVAVFRTAVFPEGPQWNLPVREAVWAALNGDGRLVAAVGRTGRVQLFRWDRENATYAPVLVSGQHENTILRAAFSPDGGQLFTLGADYALRTWDFQENATLNADLFSNSELFCERLTLASGTSQETTLPDFDLLGRARGTHETWLAVTVPPRKLVVFNLGRIYVEQPPTNPGPISPSPASDP